MDLRLVAAERVDRNTTEYLLQNEDNVLFWGQTTFSVDAVKGTSPYSLRRTRLIDPDAVFPPYQEHMTEYDGEESDDVFVKRQNLLGGRRITRGPEVFIALTKREVEVGELLARNPHPNVCPYLGVTLDEQDRIVGVAYKRYATDLWNTMARNKYVDTDHVLKCVQKAVLHMHRQGLVHCDLRPSNIFLKGREVALGDFDATHKVGQPLDHKGWNLECEFGDKVDKELDMKQLRVLRAELETYAQKVKKPKDSGPTAAAKRSP
jgi:serine/threonine protein kinase